MPRKAYLTVAEAATIADRSKTQIRNMMRTRVLEWFRGDNGPKVICRKSLDKYIRAIKSGRIKRGNFSLCKKD